MYSRPYPALYGPTESSGGLGLCGAGRELSEPRGGKFRRPVEGIPGSTPTNSYFLKSVLVLLFLPLTGCAPGAMIEQYGEGDSHAGIVDSADMYGPVASPYPSPMLPEAGYAYPVIGGQPQLSAGGRLILPPGPVPVGAGGAIPPFPQVVMPAGVSGSSAQSHMLGADPMPVIPVPSKKSSTKRN